MGASALTSPFILRARHQPPRASETGRATIRFPAARSHSMVKALSIKDARPPGAYTAQGSTASARPLVLVVEDHEDTRFLLRTILETRGVRVVEAENGETAITLAESLQPDLILMDGTLPLLDGFAATRHIRGLASASDVPILFLSGHAQPASEARAFAAGCTDYLVKPFALGELERRLERHLSPWMRG